MMYNMPKGITMEPVFTLQYAEWVVAEELKKCFKNMSIFIPLSRQEKGIDLMLYNFNNDENKVLTFQIKSSRTYIDKTKKEFYGHLLFNQFKVYDNADWFILCGIYPSPENSEMSPRNFKWQHILLALTKDEMKTFLNNVRTKKENKVDTKFQLSFDLDRNIFQTRGCSKHTNLNNFLFKNRIKDIKNSFKGGVS